MKRLLLPLFICCAIIVNAQTPLRKLQMAEYAIKQLYVDSVNEDKLVEAAIIKMLSQLDPHSTYSTPEEVKELN